MNETPITGVCPCHGLPQADLLLRKSKVVREGERALSIRDQEHRGRAWAAEHGYCVRKVWRENLSAWSDVRRPKYDAAMAAVLLGEVPCLWVYALDRFSRKGAEAVVPILGKARVIFDYERLDSMDERDRRWIIDRAENAREYSQRLSYNVTNTKATQRNEGRWLGKAPFGVVVDPATRKLRPDTRPYMCLVQGRREVTPWEVIKRVITEVANGVSGRALALKMNKEGLRTVNGAQWRISQIRDIVNHPVFEGWLSVSKRPSMDQIPYLNEKGEKVRCVEKSVLPEMIPAALAAKARRMLTGNQVMPNTPRPGRASKPLTGRVKCSGCMLGMISDGNSYICTSLTHGALCPAPARASAKCLERFVVEQWADRLHRADDDDEIMIAVAERWQALNRPDDNQALQDARAELRAAQAKLDKFHQDDREGFYTGRSARYRIPTKNAAEARVDAAEARVRELSNDGPVDVTFLFEGEAAKHWEAAAPELRRDLLGLAIDTVIVCKSPGGRGTRFKGAERVTFQWAKPAEPDAEDFAQAA
ncbi:recombinase family protein [Kitasatospora sp. NPDC098652]|uniref:recombinase family protein n=1 Tax=Kitasatospora sp. NPDC098652 TaxID=3364095 RepID=UPI0037FBA14A